MAYDKTKPISGTTKFNQLYQIIRDHIAALRGFFASVSSPSSPDTGQMWYDTTNKVYKIYNGSSWTDLSEWSIEKNEKWKTIASASTINVGGVNRAYITGTTTITDLSNGYDGQEIIILAGASFTVQHTATQLDLVGGSNFNMDANDTLTLVYDELDVSGSRWRERKRSDNT